MEEGNKGERHFSTRDLTLMTILGVTSSLFILTAPFIPIPFPFPGFSGVVFIPLSTALILVARGLVRKTGATTFTQVVNGILSFILPGGPGILILPASIISGIVVDFFLIWHSEPVDSRVVCGIAGFIPHVFVAFFMYWGFNVVFGRVFPLALFLLVFMGLHGILGALGGIAAHETLKRIRLQGIG